MRKVGISIDEAARKGLPVLSGEEFDMEDDMGRFLLYCSEDSVLYVDREELRGFEEAFGVNVQHWAQEDYWKDQVNKEEGNE